MKSMDVIKNLFKPLIERQQRLNSETPEERCKRIQDEFGLYHGKGKRKRKNKKKKKIKGG